VHNALSWLSEWAYRRTGDLKKMTYKILVLKLEGKSLLKKLGYKNNIKTELK
jgi:hypothetical protein